MSYPYEFTLRRPGVEINVRTEDPTLLAKTHEQAYALLDTASRNEEENAVYRFGVPIFLSKKHSVLKKLSHYERKYPGCLIVDFSIELTSNVTIQETEAGVNFTLSDEQISKARTRVKALMPPGTREMWIVTHGNLTETEAARLTQPLSLTDRAKLDHSETDLGDMLRVVVFCFSSTERNLYE